MTKAGRRYGGRYEVTGRLGAGGMAEVYMARDHLLGRSVALKVLHPQFAGDHTFVERFRREAQAAASLNDPHIVGVYDWGSDDGVYYLVMEYVDGRNLREVLEDGPLEVERAIAVVADVCSALNFAHSHGIVHRDVKPANIVITERGQTKVMDFGIARAAADGAQTMTQTGTVMGTAAYLSPEQAQGLPVDARSDVYSAGIVLYELLTGEAPFKGDTPVATAYLHVKERPAPPSKRSPSVPPAVDAVVLRALAKDPADRYQTAEELRADLHRVLRGETVGAEPPVGDATRAIDTEDATSVMPSLDDIPRGRRAMAYFLIITMFLGILVALVALLFNFLAPPGPSVEVPSIIGKSFQGAKTDLEGVGLVAALEGQEFSETVPRGRVIAQDPDPGSKRPEGTRVFLITSRGPRSVEVPDVTGIPLADARSKLKKLGFKVAVTREFSDEVSEGRVVSQEPAAGLQAPPGSEVELVVSSGETTVRVPNITGIDEESAREIILDRGLNPIARYVCNTAEPDERVLSQTPAAGEEVPEGTDVSIEVNRAPEVPNVVGDTESEAKPALEAAGFVVAVEEVDEGPLNTGKVVDQDPNGGLQACRGDTVVIFVEQ